MDVKALLKHLKCLLKSLRSLSQSKAGKYPANRSIFSFNTLEEGLGACNLAAISASRLTQVVDYYKIHTIRKL